MSVTRKAIGEAQRKICVRYDARFVEARDLVNSGFASETAGCRPINGLRHNLTADTTGWYIWCGESFSTDPNFFKPVHTRHIYEKLPDVAELLGLPPGYRFLFAENHLDVWFDASLLHV
jgi:hypothetical protein